MSKFIIIGSGNVASALAEALQKKGHSILQVWSRKTQNAKKLAVKVKASYTNKLNELRSDADIYIIAVADNVIAQIARKINMGSKLVVHTSGTISLDVLKNSTLNYGVFYPMQTFSEDSPVEFKNIPVFVEANNVSSLKLITRLAHETVGKKNVYKMSSSKRKIVHLAAVFTNNFTNHLFAVSEHILRKNRLPFDMMRPLILQTAEKVLRFPPADIQTGPAKRGDKKIINEHLKMLKKYPEYEKIYKLISESILKKYKGKRRMEINRMKMK